MGDHLRVTVRYFAAARAAAGVDSETVLLEPHTTVNDLVAQLSNRTASLETVLRRCSFLCDGIAVRDRSARLQTQQTVDVLPPFAGG